MKALGVALALAILLTANEGRAAGGYISGQRLNELCSDESTSFNEGLCWGYIAGVYDAGKALDTATNKRQWSAGWTACVPDGVLAGQLVEVVKKWLRAHPERWHYAADSVVAGAVHETWPCPD
jgi:hypothetical protein